jgi:transcriptional regulator of acetoin/glycerol metabolism
VLDMNPGRRRQIERIAPAALAILARHAWPGNVRELRNVLAYAYATGDGPLLLPADLPPELLSPTAADAPAVRDETGEAQTAASGDLVRLRDALRHANGNRERAAAALGISRVTLWRRMREAGLLGRR